MKSGRVEYAPDYKLEKRAALASRVKISASGRPSVSREEALSDLLHGKRKEATERARLEREVIEAAKAWRKKIITAGANLWEDESRFYAAVDALTEFESKQK